MTQTEKKSEAEITLLEVGGGKAPSGHQLLCCVFKEHLIYFVYFFPFCYLPKFLNKRDVYCNFSYTVTEK